MLSQALKAATERRRGAQRDAGDRPGPAERKVPAFVADGVDVLLQPSFGSPVVPSQWASGCSRFHAQQASQRQEQQQLHAPPGGAVMPGSPLHLPAFDLSTSALWRAGEPNPEAHPPLPLKRRASSRTLSLVACAAFSKYLANRYTGCGDEEDGEECQPLTGWRSSEEAQQEGALPQGEHAPTGRAMQSSPFAQAAQQHGDADEAAPSGDVRASQGPGRGAGAGGSGAWYSGGGGSWADDDDDLDDYYISKLCGGVDPVAAFMEEERRRSSALLAEEQQAQQQAQGAEQPQAEEEAEQGQQAAAAAAAGVCVGGVACPAAARDDGEEDGAMEGVSPAAMEGVQSQELPLSASLSDELPPHRAPCPMVACRGAAGWQGQGQLWRDWAGEDAADGHWAQGLAAEAVPAHSGLGQGGAGQQGGSQEVPRAEAGDATMEEARTCPDPSAAPAGCAAEQEQQPVRVVLQAGACCYHHGWELHPCHTQQVRERLQHLGETSPRCACACYAPGPEQQLLGLASAAPVPVPVPGSVVVTRSALVASELCQQQAVRQQHGGGAAAPEVLELERVASCAHCAVAGDVRALVSGVAWQTLFGSSPMGR